MRALEETGFYTLSDVRAHTALARKNLERCELVLTRRCNFSCPYCRKTGPEDMSWQRAMSVVKGWASRACKNYRFSGGEPTLWGELPGLVLFAASFRATEHVAVSTNGSAPLEVYEDLHACGVNDFSISLDACCASTASVMSGGACDLEHIKKAINLCASMTYTTVGVVLTKENLDQIPGILEFAYQNNVADVRLISAAQWDAPLAIHVEEKYLKKFPILAYRYQNMLNGVPVRGLRVGDLKKCGLVLDDMAVSGDCHYPCIIYLREGGVPIGSVYGDMKAERSEWYRSHDPHTDPICQKNCLDVCVAYNNKIR
jgi:molybdenum cofactor biosynthesis enzyme MoaA